MVGAGHNGLVCACYLAQAGLEVLVVEQADRPGGGSRTDETVPGYRFDTHSVAHNIINATPVARELRLADVGLEYREMDPFAVAVFADGRIVRFHRSIERTVVSIAEVDRREAEAYRRFRDVATPLLDPLVAWMGAGGGAPGVRAALKHAPAAARTFAGQPRQIAHDLLGSYGRVLEDRLGSDLTRGPVAAFAAHASAGPQTPRGARFVYWQAVYHRIGQWHAVGGSDALTAALVRRLESFGGEVRCGSPVARIDARGRRAQGVRLESGERITADLVVTANNPRTALLELADPPLSGRVARRLRATHVSNAVQAVVHVATDRLPAYRGARPGDWNGLQSYVDTLANLEAAFVAAGDRRLRTPAPAYAFTTSALDDSLAPADHHTVYLASPAAPFETRRGWQADGQRLAEDLIAQVEVRAPGFRDSIRGVSVRTPEQMARELRWPGAHPMHLDLTPDQAGPRRPTRALASHRTPIERLYISGAGTAPFGGVSGLPGRAAAGVVLQDAARLGRS
ncbi:MAG: NAD(P)/FAD-dependent oxidoreductase [Actinobacteria bacterium]|nr:NAD(P)/FAD-dependent oxidoreductase [Actinomycetota bacterium]